MLQGDNSAILSTFIKLPFVFKIFVLSIFEWPFFTGFTVFTYNINYMPILTINKIIKTLMYAIEEGHATINTSRETSFLLNEGFVCLRNYFSTIRKAF